MKTLNLIQGSPAWHAHRVRCFNASEAPAMMGVSPYETREQFMVRLKTGIQREIDAETQALFDRGHETEAKARALAEAIISEDLYPVAGVEDDTPEGMRPLAASFDGLTMDESQGFEHKMLNSVLRQALPRQGENEGVTLPDLYRVQLEQQLIVSGADRILFGASAWNGDECTDWRWTWYESDPGLHDRIIGGWALLAEELKYFDPTASASSEVKPIGKTMETLPALLVKVEGKVVASNLAEFKEHALAVFEGINRNLTTDQEFADAKATVKWCGDVEGKLKAALQHARAQMGDIDELFRVVEEVTEAARRTRLDLDKLVTKRESEVKIEIVQNRARAFSEHCAALHKRIGMTCRLTEGADFGGAIKGKRNLESMNAALDALLANLKVEANATADRAEVNAKSVPDDLKHLFPDLITVATKSADDFANLLAARKGQHEAAQREREERVRKEAEERIRKEAEAVRVQAEQADQQAAAPAPASITEDDGERLNVGDINAMIAPLTITAEGLKRVGINPVNSTGVGKLYRACDKAMILSAIAGIIARAQKEA